MNNDNDAFVVVTAENTVMLIWLARIAGEMVS